MVVTGDEKEKRPDPLKQCAVAALMLVVCAIFASQLGKIYVEPRDAGLGARGLPDFLLFAGTGLALLQLGLNLPAAVRRYRGGAFRSDTTTLMRVGILTMIAFAYVWAITLFQYALPTLLTLSALLLLFGSRSAFRLAVLPVIVVAIYWFVFFVLLGIFEVPGRLLEYDSYSVALRIRQLIGLQ